MHAFGTKFTTQSEYPPFLHTTPLQQTLGQPSIQVGHQSVDLFIAIEQLKTRVSELEKNK
ncbi:unnamed protein product, partial [Brachionus calyciflorus]